MLRTFVVVALLCAAGCGNRAQLLTEDAASVSVEDTTLGPGDVFEVRVFGQPDFTGTYKVASDGAIQFPFLGIVQAGGKEPEHLAKLLASRLKDEGYLTDPHVSVLVEQSNSKRLSLF